MTFSFFDDSQLRCPVCPAPKLTRKYVSESETHPRRHKGANDSGSTAGLTHPPGFALLRSLTPGLRAWKPRLHASRNKTGLGFVESHLPPERAGPAVRPDANPRPSSTGARYASAS